MSMVTGPLTFRSYYNDLLKNPKHAINDQENVISGIKSTFEAFGSSELDKPKEIKIRNMPVILTDLTTSDITLFTQFTKEFFKTISLPEKEALEMHEKITLAEKKIPLDRKGPLFLVDITNTKQHLLLNAKIDSSLPNTSESISEKAVHRISELLKVQQKKGIDLEKQVKNTEMELKKRDILSMISIGGIVVASAILVTSSVLLGLSLIFPPIGIAGMMLAGILAGVSYFRLMFSERLNSPINNFQADLKNTLLRFEKLESYKKLVEDEKYVAFTQDPRNGYQKFLTDNEFSSNFLELFELETKYQETFKNEQKSIEVAEKNLKEVNEQIEKNRQEGKLIDQRVRLAKTIQESYQRINWASKSVKAQREKMGLEVSLERTP